VGLELGNGRNLRRAHCYQEKNGDRLVGTGAIGEDLRRELTTLYPYLTTLFAAHGLEPGFVDEEAHGLYPDSDEKGSGAVCAS
jgi:hypothetical protein